MKSMTGYGKGEAASDSKTLVIELKAVNNRYLDINSRVSKLFSFADDIIKKCIQDKIKRGTIEVIFSYNVTGKSGKTVDVDYSLASEYINKANELCEKFGINNDFTVSKLIKMPEILTVSAQEENREEITALFKEATEKAVAELEKMRLLEGKSIKADLSGLVGNIEKNLEKVKQYAPKVSAAYAEKLRAKIADMTADVAIDEARLATEVAYFADRADINEEISRLSSHIAQFYSVLELSDAQGRRLDFLSQEMNREINTMGSKANDLDLTNIVIEMKNELEKIKEQIRNVE